MNHTEQQPAQRPRRWQFGIGGLLTLLLTTALICLVVVNTRTHYTVTIHCTQFPANDERLRARYEELGAENLEITRWDEGARLRFSRREFVTSMAHFSSHWEDYGYGGIRAVSFETTQSTPISRTIAWLWESLQRWPVMVLLGVVVVAVAVYCRGRRRSRRGMTNDEGLRPKE